MARSKPAGNRFDSGGAAVEFAFTLPVLILFLFGIIQFGSVYFVKNNMLNAARQAARLMVVDNLSGSGNSVACASAPNGSAEEIACGSLVNFGLNFTVKARQPDPSDPDDTDVSVEITVPAEDASIVDVLGLFGTENIRVRVIMHKENA